MEKGSSNRQIKVIKVDWLGNFANYKEDYNAPLYDVVCTVTDMITVNVIFQWGIGVQKHITKKVNKFPNQSTLLTLVRFSARSAPAGYHEPLDSGKKFAFFGLLLSNGNFFLLLT